MKIESTRKWKCQWNDKYNEKWGIWNKKLDWADKKNQKKKKGKSKKQKRMRGNFGYSVPP